MCVLMPGPDELPVVLGKHRREGAGFECNAAILVYNVALKGEATL